VPDEVVIGGGNARLLGALPAGCRTVDNAMAFVGGYRLWAGERGPAAKKRVSA
jgi:polyphosphate glucokinase